MRSAGGTNSGPPRVVTRATKSRMARFVAPWFQEGKGSAGISGARTEGAAGALASSVLALDGPPAPDLSPGAWSQAAVTSASTQTQKEDPSLIARPPGPSRQALSNAAAVQRVVARFVRPFAATGSNHGTDEA